jgi:hypothetical protein
MKAIVDAWWTRISGGLAILTLILWAVGALFDARWSLICGELGIFLMMGVGEQWNREPA